VGYDLGLEHIKFREFFSFGMDVQVDETRHTTQINFGWQGREAEPWETSRLLQPTSYTAFLINDPQEETSFFLPAGNVFYR
jgi:hypothetical protein